ncbi:uncharacterized protein LOC142621663 [Castanea sativa]|uniref:uncharacterized protein LOC142621663 n=1 Tax=Castanea sativa TaxID=21020 RepID=UPI003F64CF25
MREGETLKTYSDRYWELYNEIDGDFEDVAVWTFKVGLPTNADLWKSLTMKPPRNVHQLMDRIKEQKRVEGNQSSTKGKNKVEGPEGEASSKRCKVSDQPIIGFSKDDKLGTIQPYDDALVVTVQISGYDVKKVMIDQGNGAEIMYPNLFKGLGLKLEDLDQYDSPLIGFNGSSTIPRGRIRSPFLTRNRMVSMDFIVVDAFLLYTAILARPWLHAMVAVASSLHVKVKYPTNGRVDELVGSKDKAQLVGFLKDNLDVFAWNAYEAPMVDLEFICHHLNVNPSGTSKKQIPWPSSKEHAEAVKDKVHKLKQAGAIKEVFYPKWLANTVVKKKSRKWRVCVYFTDLNKIKAIHDLHPPRNPKEVKRLTGMMATMNRFISKSAEWCRPFFKLLHKWKDFTWFEECDRAFEELKAYLAHLPILSRLENEEVLYAYVVVSQHAALLRKSDYTGRVAKWGTMLEAVDVKYMPQIVVKGQVLADLVVEFVEELGCSKVGERLEGPVHVETVITQCTWQLFVDGATNKKGLGIGIVMVSPDGITLEKLLRLGFLATTNEAEYEALLAGLNAVQKLGGKTIRAYCDSRLVVGQVLGEYEAKDLRMHRYLGRVKRLSRDFHSFTLEQIPQGKNSHADSLTTLATVVEMLLEELHEGICGSHTGGKSLARRALTQGYSTPSYPQNNGQAGATNKVILDGLKKKLKYAKGKGVVEMPHVLWTYRTTPRRSTSETSFSMTYGAEAVIPTEIGFPTLRSNQPLGNGNEQFLAHSLDLAKELREMVAVRLVQYQQKLRQGFERKVKVRTVIPGDLVLQKVVGSARNPSWGKLGPN